ncbi:YkvA family protein [Desulfoglaeba alkanexedens]|uniref:DUF1232 domain-containing protein n=1 Tax=Desulfoglaeba alkanexedens ALDC TaxID=980445 RepID=A0A4P8KYY4_9BACT|nr:DUF1232 domain-containing protein [Desulfoglaeba alkanexedens ALDC]
MLKRFWPVLLWLLYFVSPVDLFPDTVFGPGWTDDVALLGLLLVLEAPETGSRKRGGRLARPEHGLRPGPRRGPDGGHRTSAGNAGGAGKLHTGGTPSKCWAYRPTQAGMRSGRRITDRPIATIRTR